jgi:hypothetical protein
LSVRRLIVLVVAIAASLGWVVRSARVQREAVAEIKRNGGSIYYDWEVKDGQIIPSPHPWVPRWLVGQIGIDYFGHVVCVIAQTRRAGDAILAPAGRLSRLERLDLSGSSVTDAGLSQLKALTRLQTLELGGTDVGDNGMANLEGLQALRTLRLDGTRVGDVGLMHLKGLALQR